MPRNGCERNRLRQADLPGMPQSQWAALFLGRCSVVSLSVKPTCPVPPLPPKRPAGQHNNAAEQVKPLGRSNLEARVHRVAIQVPGQDCEAGCCAAARVVDA